MRRRESDMGKSKNQQGTTRPDSVLGSGVPAPDFKLRSTQLLRPDRETGAPGAPAYGLKLQTLPPDRFVSLSELRRSEEHTSELQSLTNLVCRLLLDIHNRDVPSY